MTTVTTLLLAGVVGLIGGTLVHRAGVLFWGRRTALLLGLGLVTCCFAAARDGLDKTIQCAIDHSCAPGLFPLVSLPTLVGCLCAALILLAAIATPLSRTQAMRERWFWLMSASVALKLAVVELARVVG